MNQLINAFITGLNNIGQVFWDYAATVFIQTSVLIVLLLILDFLLRKRVRAVFRYCLWTLLFVKLVLPASFTREHPVTRATTTRTAKRAFQPLLAILHITSRHNDDTAPGFPAKTPREETTLD